MSETAIVAAILALAELLPVQALMSLAKAIYDLVNAKNEKEAMQAAVKAVDAQVDAAEEEDLKLGPLP